LVLHLLSISGIVLKRHNLVIKKGENMKPVFKFGVFILATSFFMSNSALANSNSVSKPIVPKNSLYIDGNVGYGSLFTPEKTFCDAFSDRGYGCPLSSASYKIGGIVAGADVNYRFAINPRFLVGGEFGYNYNGTSTYKGGYWDPVFQDDANFTYHVKSEDLHLMATGTTLFGNGISLFVKGGAARVHQTLVFSDIEGDFPAVLPTTKQSLNAIKPMAAVGIGFERNIFNVYLQYSHIFGTDAEKFSDFFDTSTQQMNKVVSVDTIKLGVGVVIPIL
jgi:hypothetical protein